MKRAALLYTATILSTVVLGCGSAYATDATQANVVSAKYISNPNPLISGDVAKKSEQDHARTMAMMHIQSLRPGPEANPELSNVTNFDESKAGPFSKVPDPLTLDNGTKVTSAEVWWRLRRPQIVEAFDREILGRVPQHVPAVHWKVVSVMKGTSGGVPFVRKELLGHIDNSAAPSISVDIQVTLTTPANAKKPSPVIMELMMSEKDTAVIVDMLKINLADMSAEPILGMNPKGYNWQQDALKKGWGYAIYVPTSVQADNGAGLTKGIIGLVNKGKPRTKPDEWGALRAWAWGASRALDYFEQDHSVDAKHVAIAGASRYGKAALVAMAYDSRFATANIASSGEAGAKLYRHIFGEQIENIAAANEYYWMAPNFLKYAGPLTVNDLPVDANELIALCAPRPIFIGAGHTRNDGKWTPVGSDGWADAKGEFLAAADASHVYKLLGKKPLSTDIFPPIGTTLIDSDIAFRQHTGGHMTGPNWPTFMQFAARHLPIAN